MNLKRSMAICILILAAATVFAGGNRESGSVRDNETRAVEASANVAMGETVSIWIPVGTITVKGWDRPAVAISGTVSGAIEDVVVERTPQGTEVRALVAEPPKRGEMKMNSTVTVSVPFDSVLSVELLGGSLAITGLRVNVAARTATATITVSGDLEKLAAETMAGQIMFNGTVGDVEFASATGDITLDGASGSVTGTSLNGAIRVVGRGLGYVDIATTMGDIAIVGDVLPEATIRAVSQLRGRIELELPETVAGLFTVGGLPAGDSLDMTRFQPQAATTDVFATGGAAMMSGSRITVGTTGKQADRNDLTAAADKRLGLTLAAPRLPRGIVTGATREFRVGDGDGRFVVDAGGWAARTGGEAEGAPIIVIRTRK